MSRPSRWRDARRDGQTQGQAGPPFLGPSPGLEIAIENSFSPSFRQIGINLTLLTRTKTKKKGIYFLELSGELVGVGLGLAERVGGVDREALWPHSEVISCLMCLIQEV